MFRSARQRAEPPPEVQPHPLMEAAARAARSLGELDADLRAGGFGQNCRGLARELYASFTATVVATRGTEAEAMAWALGRALAIDLERAGARRAALALLFGLIEFGASHADPQILARLRETQEAIDQKTGWRRRAAARADKEREAPPAPPAVEPNHREGRVEPWPPQAAEEARAADAARAAEAAEAVRATEAAARAAEEAELARAAEAARAAEEAELERAAEAARAAEEAELARASEADRAAEEAELARSSEAHRSEKKSVVYR